MENKKEVSINTDDLKIEESAKIDLSKPLNGKKKDLGRNGFKNEIRDRKRKAKIFFVINLAIFAISVIALIVLFYFIAKSKDVKITKPSSVLLQSEIKNNI